MPLRPARPVRPDAMLQHFGVLRHLGVDDEPEVGQIDAARGDVGGDAHPRPAVAQACRAWLRSCWPSSPDSSTAEKPRSSSMACRWRTDSRVLQNTSARRRLVEAQDVDHRLFDFVGRDAHGAIFDIGMAALAAGDVDAQGVLLVRLANATMRFGRVAENSKVRRCSAWLRG